MLVFAVMPPAGDGIVANRTNKFPKFQLDSSPPGAVSQSE